jgi:D-glycero-D-manno-heptose 1,7-bisphosphate phosphatase
MSAERALFLDRDGVINVDHDYVATPDRFEFIPGVFEVARAAFGRGYRLVVVTNQSGIGRGYYNEAAFAALTTWMSGEFARQGAPLTAVAFCPYLPTAALPHYARDSHWRKPRPGMILELARRHRLDVARSILIGDQPSDMRAATAAGVGRRLYLAGKCGATCADADASLAQLTDALAWL